jgi:hypothetical protein
VISVSDIVLTSLIAVAAGVSLASVVPAQSPRYVSYAPPPSIEMPLEFAASPSVSNTGRLDVVQEKLEVQSVRIQEIDRKLNLLLSPRDQGDDGPKGQ